MLITLSRLSPIYQSVAEVWLTGVAHWGLQAIDLIFKIPDISLTCGQNYDIIKIKVSVGFNQ